MSANVKRWLLGMALCLAGGHLYAQTYWKNPLNETVNVIQGIAMPGAARQPFARLPDALKLTVRTPVWNLGQQCAGEYVEFTSNAARISVRYQVQGVLQMPHMPATGVSGVDLYVHNGKGQWEWAPGRYSFKDTVNYTFDHLADQRGTIFRLYLPLYNGIKWLEIGVEPGKTLSFLPPADERPVVVYGTSIAQGGCASRPGLAWPSILGRKLNVPVINLAFSGNGRLEEPVISLMNTLSARIFVLDCMPNLADKTLYPEDELRKRIMAAVASLKEKHPQTPILLVEHSGGADPHLLDTRRMEEFRSTSAILTKVFKELKAKGISGIYHLSSAEIGMNIESTVDGVHPNDIGMMEHATAFARKIRAILK